MFAAIRQFTPVGSPKIAVESMRQMWPFHGAIGYNLKTATKKQNFVSPAIHAQSKTATFMHVGRFLQRTLRYDVLFTTRKIRSIQLEVPQRKVKLPYDAYWNLLFLFKSMLSRTWYDIRTERFQAVPILSFQMHSKFQQKEKPTEGGMDENIS